MFRRPSYGGVSGVLELRREMIIILLMLRKISKMINIEFKMYIKAADK